MGYHRKKIKKGVYGLFSKIKEEFEELEDAHEQGSKILELVELADLYGAIEKYAETQLKSDMQQIKYFAHLTNKAFKDGSRK